MSQSVVQNLLVPILAGVVGAASTALVLSMDPDHALPSGTEAAAVEPLRQQLTQVEGENALLKRRIDDLEQMVWRMPAPGVTSATGEPRPLVDEDVLALRRQVDALTAALSDASTGEGGGAFIDTVASALEQIREREDQQREDERKAFMEQRLDERLGELATEIGLDAWQQKELKSLFTDTGSQRDAIFTKARESGDFAGIRDAMQAIDADRNARLASLLTPSQLEKYNELGGVERGFFGGPGRGWGGGFDGGRRGPGGGGPGGPAAPGGQGN